MSTTFQDGTRPGYYYPQFVVVKPGSEPIIVLRALEALGLPVRSWFSNDQLITFTDTENPIDKLVEALGRLGLEKSRISLETHGWYFTQDMYRDFSTKLPCVETVPSDWIVESLRKIKSPAEIEEIRKACKIAEIGIQTAVDRFERGMTEAALAGHIHEGNGGGRL